MRSHVAAYRAVSLPGLVDGAPLVLVAEAALVRLFPDPRKAVA